MSRPPHPSARVPRRRIATRRRGPGNQPDTPSPCGARHPRPARIRARRTRHQSSSRHGGGAGGPEGLSSRAPLLAWTPAMAGPSDELPIPQRLQAITSQWDQLRTGFDDATLAARVAELEEAMGAPGFWDDQQSAAQVSAEHARTTRRLERCAGSPPRSRTSRRWPRWPRRTSRSRPRWRARWPASRSAWPSSRRSGCSPGATTRATPSSRSTPARAAPMPRTGPRWCCG